jgi:uncharacterized protein (DUF1330 family)
MVTRLGGRVLYSGDVTGLMLGEVERPWHAIALVWYPDLRAFRRMLSSPEYEGFARHREAGLEGQLNIKTRPAEHFVSPSPQSRL